MTRVVVLWREGLVEWDGSVTFGDVEQVQAVLAKPIEVRASVIEQDVIRDGFRVLTPGDADHAVAALLTLPEAILIEGDEAIIDASDDEG